MSKYFLTLSFALLIALSIKQCSGNSLLEDDTTNKNVSVKSNTQSQDTDEIDRLIPVNIAHEENDTVKQIDIYINDKSQKIEYTYIGNINYISPNDFKGWQDYGIFAAKASTFLYGSSNEFMISRNKFSNSFLLQRGYKYEMWNSKGQVTSLQDFTDFNCGEGEIGSFTLLSNGEGFITSCSTIPLTVFRTGDNKFYNDGELKLEEGANIISIIPAINNSYIYMVYHKNESLNADGERKVYLQKYDINLHKSIWEKFFYSLTIPNLDISPNEDFIILRQAKNFSVFDLEMQLVFTKNINGELLSDISNQTIQTNSKFREIQVGAKDASVLVFDIFKNETYEVKFSQYGNKTNSDKVIKVQDINFLNEDKIIISLSEINIVSKEGHREIGDNYILIYSIGDDVLERLDSEDLKPSWVQKIDNKIQIIHPMSRGKGFQKLNFRNNEYDF